jgi:hypothetical protein
MTSISSATFRPFVGSTALEVSHSQDRPLPVPGENAGDSGLRCLKRYGLCGLYEVVPYAVAGALLTSVGPVGGAVYALGGLVIGESPLHTAYRMVSGETYGEFNRVAMLALRILISIGMGYVALSLAGFVVTPGAIAGLVIGGPIVGEMIVILTTRLFFEYISDRIDPRDGPWRA